MLEIQRSVTVKLKAIPIHESQKAMKRLKDHAEECIRAKARTAHTVMDKSKWTAEKK